MSRIRIITKADRAQSQCTGKQSYPKEDIAMRYAQRHADQIQQTMFVYQCDICSNFHLSSICLTNPKSPFPVASAAVFPK